MRARVPAAVLAALLAAAGCTISTSQFKPKTDDECVALSAATKACGNRCVALDDPSTGCATAGDCQPCPAPAEANTVAACVSGACGSGCAPGFADCDGSSTNGCEVNLQGNDAAHCGNCTHSCGSGYCSGGVCSAIVERSIVGARPRAMARDASDGSIVYALVDPAAATTQVGLSSMVCTLAGACLPVDGEPTALASAGGTRWIAVTSAGALLVVQVPPVDPVTVTTVGRSADLGDGIDALLVTSLSRVLYTTGRRRQDPSGPESWLHVLEAGSAPVGVSLAATGGPPQGLGGVDPFYYVGTDDAGGTLFLDQELAGTISQATSAVRTGTGTSKRVTGFTDAQGQPWLFWATGDGSVWRADIVADGTLGAPERIAPAGGAASAIASDADGVYWINRGTGHLWRWRASDGAVFRVGFSSSPQGLATDTGGRLYWTDDIDGKIYRVSK
jgi:hypothetical protein